MICSRIALILVLASSFARAGDLLVTLPPLMKPASASATAAGPGVSSQGEVKGQSITFHKLLDAIPYDVKVILDNGTILQGVDMSWYSQDPPKAGAKSFSDDDRKEVQAIMDVKSFYNKSDILKVQGDHDRATILAQLIRDTDFHSDKGGEIIWRVELWYFKNEYGGWAKINQANKILRRERFASRADYDKIVSHINWTPALGGIVLSPDKPASITVPTPRPPSTQPAPEEEPER